MRVVIAEDSVLLREGIGRLLADENIDIVGQAGSGDEFIEVWEQTKPDVSIVDVRMPPSHTDEGIRASIELRSRHPDARILVLSQYVEERYASELLADGNGGIGYLLKDRVADVEEFVDAIHRVAGGGTALDPAVVSQLFARRRHPIETLTDREQETLGFMAQGLTNGAIAEQMAVSVGAVEKHSSAIFTKLGLEAGASQHRRVLAVLAWLDRPR
jgi:DNA-binding NarL/FixJ family response regulator